MKTKSRIFLTTAAAVVCSGVGLTSVRADYASTVNGLGPVAYYRLGTTTCWPLLPSIPALVSASPTIAPATPRVIAIAWYWPSKFAPSEPRLVAAAERAQLDLFAPVRDPAEAEVIAALRESEPLRTTPLDALALLARGRARVGGGGEGWGAGEPRSEPSSRWPRCWQVRTARPSCGGSSTGRIPSSRASRSSWRIPPNRRCSACLRPRRPVARSGSISTYRRSGSVTIWTPTIPVGDGLLRGVRVGQFKSDTARVVIDLQRYDRHRVRTLTNPHRLLIDVYGTRGRPDPAPKPAIAAAPPSQAPSARPPERDRGGDRLPPTLRGVQTVVIDAGHRIVTRFWQGSSGLDRRLFLDCIAGNDRQPLQSGHLAGQGRSRLAGASLLSPPLIAWLTNPVAPLMAGLLADFVFEPAFVSPAPTPTFFSQLIGSGSGAGMSLLIFLCGCGGALVGLSGYLFPQIRNVEDILPDHDQLELAPEVMNAA